MTIQYNGKSLCGWQIQKKTRTVQGDIEQALKKIFKDQKINLVGSGRTDSGVHALGQIANIKLTTNMSEKEILNALNGNLKDDIYISDCIKVSMDFSSRFSAIKREYEYRIMNIYSPIYKDYFWHINDNIDIQLLNKCAQLVIGKHDFTQLSKKNDEIDNRVCDVFISSWIMKKNQILYKIIANRFLHHMVRYLVGTMIEISKNNNVNINDFKSMIEGKDRSVIFKAPAKGLYLKKVYYA